MSPLGLALTWAGAGVLGGAMLPRLHRRRLAWIVVLGAALAGLAAAPAATWPGPAASHAYGASLVLGRPALGLLVAGGIALAATLAIAPHLEGAESLAACLVVSACVVVLGATVPIIWGLAVALAAAVLALRWIAAAPGRATLAAGRVMGLGGAVLVGAAVFVPAAGPAVDNRTALAGGLLAGGVCAQLALVPLGGWAPSVARAVSGADLAPWVMLLAPSVLLTAGVLLPALPGGARVPLANVLLVLGLASAVFGAVQAARASPAVRYSRVVIADLALVAAGLGTGHTAGRLGGLVLILAHLCAGPLLVHPARPGLGRQRALAWLSLTGLPPTPAFWGRFLVLEGCAAASGTALAAGMVASAGLLIAAVRALTLPGDAAEGTPPGRLVRAVTWAVALASISLGFAPDAITTGVFGAIM